jgi:hypothetical protein
MSRPLIPNDITVSEQFKRLNALNQAFDSWSLDRFGKLYYTAVDEKILDEFLLDSGIRCSLGRFAFCRQLLSPVIEDEKLYLLFRLKYS